MKKKGKGGWAFEQVGPNFFAVLLLLLVGISLVTRAKEGMALMHLVVAMCWFGGTVGVFCVVLGMAMLLGSERRGWWVASGGLFGVVAGMGCLQYLQTLEL